MRTQIILALIRLARLIGTWILKRLAKVGYTLLSGYMLGKIDDYRRARVQAAQARHISEVRRFTRKIKRWSRVLAWLKKNGGEVVNAEVGLLCKKADVRMLPLVSKEELADRCFEAA